MDAGCDPDRRRPVPPPDAVHVGMHVPSRRRPAGAAGRDLRVAAGGRADGNQARSVHRQGRETADDREGRIAAEGTRGETARAAFRRRCRPAALRLPRREAEVVTAIPP